MGEAVGDNVATKAGLAEAKTEITGFKVALKTDLASLESRPYHYLWIMAASIVGLIAALVKLTA